MQLLLTLLLAVMGVSLSANAAQAPAPLFDLSCSLSNVAREVDSLRDVPEPVSNELRSRLMAYDAPAADFARRFPHLDMRLGEIADRGEQFNPTDTGGGIKRRFSRGAESNGIWFIWYEHGGIAPHLHVVLFRIAADGSLALIANDAIWRGSLTVLLAGPGKNAIPVRDVCSRTEDLLAGRATPYSSDW